MNAVGVIPARMGSSRFPGKPLAPILGRPMIEHVYRRVALCEQLEAVYVATCDEEIARAVDAFGGRWLMTSTEHERASDRVAEAAAELDADVVVMVQGDEPMTTPQMVAESLDPFEDEGVRCVNLIARITSPDEFADPNTIKVVRDEEGHALFFSRAPIPAVRETTLDQVEAWKQVCVIPFRREALLEFAALPPTPLEIAESVDMLRFLEHGLPVHLVETTACTRAVDTRDDLAAVERLLREDPLVAAYA